MQAYMKTFMLIPLLVLATLAAAAQERLPQWALGEFIRPATDGALISPDSSSTFLCPMRGTRVKWEEGATFNPAAAVKGGKIHILYRAEDNLATGIGVRTSRLGD